MGWHDPKLRAQEIRHLLSLAHLGRLWDERGPTPEAVALRRSPDLPKQERALLEAANALEDLIEHHGPPSRRRASPPEART